jgi:hypothetical protein
MRKMVVLALGALFLGGCVYAEPAPPPAGVYVAPPPVVVAPAPGWWWGWHGYGWHARWR